MSTETCKEIAVEAKASSESNGKFTITLNFATHHNAADFTINVFGQNRNNNRLNLSGSEITDISKDNYVLIIQSKRDDDFCAKQLKLNLR